MRKFLIIAALAFAHFLAYTFCTIREFDTNAWFPFTWEPSESHATWLFLMKALEFPVATVANSLSAIPHELQLPAMILNSLLWGSVAYYIFSRLLRRRLMTVSF